jgi:hypothetical protein
LPVNVKTTADEVAAEKVPLAAFVATTEHVPGVLTLNVAFLLSTTHDAGVALKVRAPLPEPPVVVSLTTVV